MNRRFAKDATKFRVLFKLRADPDCPDFIKLYDFELRILRPGKWQRSAGAWVWCLNQIKKRGVGIMELGSCDTIKDILRADSLEFSKTSYGCEVYAVGGPNLKVQNVPKRA